MAHIPLQDLESSSRDTGVVRRHTSLEGGSDEKRGHVRSTFSSRRGSQSAGSDFSLRSDTGDLAEQLADEEDPHRKKLRDSVDEDAFGGASRTRYRLPKYARFQRSAAQERQNSQAGLDKEDIEIPVARPRQVPAFEKLLAAIMNGRGGGGQMHGLVGKPLLYAFLSSVSLDPRR